LQTNKFTNRQKTIVVKMADTIGTPNKMTNSTSSASGNDGSTVAVTNATDPKNIQDLTTFVQTLLQQMQERFQQMSDQIIARIDDMGTR